jgi:DNA-binding transcriptional LysR family regulator
MDRLRLYEVFVRIVERGNMSAAARDLQMPQPTVSRLLKSLEQQLGARLLERDTHNMSLTEQGALLYERALRLIEEFAFTESAVRSSQTELTGTLRVNAPVAFGEVVLVRLLADFQRQHPALEIELELNDRRVDLVEEGVDVALRFGRLESLNLVAHKVALAKRVLVASPGYLKAHGAPRRADDLARHNVLLYQLLDDAQALELTRGEQRLKVSVRGNFRCSNGLALVSLYEAGIGVGEAVEFLVHEALLAKRLVPILRSYRREPMEVHAMHPPGRYVKPKVRALIEALKISLPEVHGFTRP